MELLNVPKDEQECMHNLYLLGRCMVSYHEDPDLDDFEGYHWVFQVVEHQALLLNLYAHSKEWIELPPDLYRETAERAELFGRVVDSIEPTPTEEEVSDLVQGFIKKLEEIEG